MKILLTILILIFKTHALVNGECDTCGAANIACVNATSFKLCINGQIFPDLILNCPNNLLCNHDDANRCVELEKSPSCARYCGSCNPKTNVACLDHETFSFCLGSEPSSIIAKCQNGFVCDTTTQAVCVDPSETPSCPLPPPLLPNTTISTTTEESVTTTEQIESSTTAITPITSETTSIGTPTTSTSEEITTEDITTQTSTKDTSVTEEPTTSESTSTTEIVTTTTKTEPTTTETVTGGSSSTPTTTEETTTTSGTTEASTTSEETTTEEITTTTFPTSSTSEESTTTEESSSEKCTSTPSEEEESTTTTTENPTYSPTATEEQPSSTTTTTTTLEPTLPPSEATLFCQRVQYVGRFSKPNSCRRYYECKKRNGNFIGIENRCPLFLSFDCRFRICSFICNNSCGVNA